jgi:hypothetical protein
MSKTKAGKWMELNIIMLRRISQAQKVKYHIFSHVRTPDLKNDMIVKGEAGTNRSCREKGDDDVVNRIKVLYVCV